MNISDEYLSFIEQCRSKEPLLTGYVERHHILPRCFGGGDDPENIIRLTAADHFTAHLLIAESNTGNYKACAPLNYFMRVAPTAEEYERAKVARSKSMSAFMKKAWANDADRAERQKEVARKAFGSKEARKKNVEARRKTIEAGLVDYSNARKKLEETKQRLFSDPDLAEGAERCRAARSKNLARLWEDEDFRNRQLADIPRRRKLAALTKKLASQPVRDWVDMINGRVITGRGFEVASMYRLPYHKLEYVVATLGVGHDQGFRLLEENDEVVDGFVVVPNPSNCRVVPQKLKNAKAVSQEIRIGDWLYANMYTRPSAEDRTAYKAEYGEEFEVCHAAEEV